MGAEAAQKVGRYGKDGGENKQGFPPPNASSEATPLSSFIWELALVKKKHFKWWVNIQNFDYKAFPSLHIVFQGRKKKGESYYFCGGSNTTMGRRKEWKNIK